MKALVASIVLAAGLASSALAFAQTPPLSIEVIPNSPTTRSPVTIRVGIDRCNVGPSTVTYPAPNEIRFDISTIFCPGLIFGPVEFTIGQLPAGVYTVSVFTGSVPRGSATFTVLAASASGAAPIPTLSEFALLGLMLVVGLTGAIHRRKHKSNLFSVATLCLTAAAAVLVPSFSGGGAHAAGEGAIDASPRFVPNRIKIRFNRALLDPSRELIQEATLRPASSPLAAILGYPVSVKRLIGREPTSFEMNLAKRFPNTPEARLTQYYLLDYSSVASADLAREAISRDSRFEYVGRDPLADAAAVPGDWYVGVEPSALPKGQYQWGFHALRFPDAFEKYTGTARVGVADYGISLDIRPGFEGQYHPDIKKNFRTHLSRNFTDAVLVGLPFEARESGYLADAAYIFIPGSNPPAVRGPFAGHGTHVSGLIAADWEEGVQGIVGGVSRLLAVGRQVSISQSKFTGCCYKSPCRRRRPSNQH